MSEVFIYTIVSVIIVSLLSFTGALVLALKQTRIKNVIILLVSFAAGALLGDVFIHLLPELVHEGFFYESTPLFILLGISLFFVLEKILHWRHCHMTATEGHTHPLATMNLIGDGLHNFIDGLLIAGSYLLSIPVGIATTIAVIFHEIPQEMGDMGVLLHAGMKPKKALFFNFLSALTAVAGALLIFGLSMDEHDLIPFIIPVTMGGFIYIANSDLIPELHKETALKKSLAQLTAFLIGIGIMFAMTFLPFHSHEHGGQEEAQHVHMQDYS